ncbi:GNAT family N-acetyltransferase [Chloroflexi bacterium TSY]|nr:GNAT family N-acetyltransferase [Chloroflexi bacterium TSY]
MTNNITIRPAQEIELPALNRWFPSNRPMRHRRYWQLQERGAITYLIAWQGDRPIGHGTIRWLGPRDPIVAASYPKCPEILGLGVVPELQSRGIGSRMLEEFVQLAHERELDQIGLAVGLTNTRAQALYLRHGYRDTATPTYLDRWYRRNDAGQKIWHEDECKFMIKQI